MIFTSWNPLPSGVPTDAYITATDSDECVGWETRRLRIKGILLDLVTKGDVVGMQDVDSFFWLLHEMRAADSRIHGIWVLPNTYASSVDPGNETNLLQAASRHRTFESEHCPAEFAAQRCYLAGNPTSQPLKSKYHSPAGLALFWHSDKLSVVNPISSVGWYSWGITGYMSYGYSCNDYITLRCVPITRPHPMLSVCIAKLSESNQSHDVVDQIVDEIDRTGDGGFAIVLADTKRTPDGSDLVQTSAEIQSHVLPAEAELKTDQSNQIWVERGASLHWDAVPSPSSFWQPPTSHASILAELAANVECQEILSDAGAQRLWNGSIILGTATGNLNNHLNRMATIIGVNTETLVEALMCVQPNSYAPSVSTPVSVRFYP